MHPYDILITGGTIVDGTGAPRHAGAVGVTRSDEGATLAVLPDQPAIDEAARHATRLIDATGQVVRFSAAWESRARRERSR